MCEITSTHDMAESEWDGGSEPGEVASDIVATTEPEGKGIEFSVSMRDYTMHDMEALIVEAAAKMIVGRHNDRELAKTIEAKCIEQITAKADKALSAVTTEIIEQPLIPNFGDKKPVTMREFIGLTGREYLTEKVDRDGKPYTGGWGGGEARTRLQNIVSDYIGRHFKSELEKATNAAVSEVQSAIRVQYEAFLTAEKARFRDALAKVS